MKFCQNIQFKMSPRSSWWVATELFVTLLKDSIYNSLLTSLYPNCIILPHLSDFIIIFQSSFCMCYQCSQPKSQLTQIPVVSKRFQCGDLKHAQTLSDLRPEPGEDGKWTTTPGDSLFPGQIRRFNPEMDLGLGRILDT